LRPPRGAGSAPPRDGSRIMPHWAGAHRTAVSHAIGTADEKKKVLISLNQQQEGGNIPTGPGPGFVTQNYNYDSIYVGNTFSGIDKPYLDPWPANLQSRRGDPPHSIEPGIRRTRKSYVHHGEKPGSESGEKCKSDWLLCRSTTCARTTPIGYVQDEFKWRPNLNSEPRRALTPSSRSSTRRTGLANPFDFLEPAGFRGSAAWAPASASRTTAISIRAWVWPGRLTRAERLLFAPDSELTTKMASGRSELPAKNEVPRTQ